MYDDTRTGSFVDHQDRATWANAKNKLMKKSAKIDKFAKIFQSIAYATLVLIFGITVIWIPLAAI